MVMPSCRADDERRVMPRLPAPGNAEKGRVRRSMTAGRRAHPLLVEIQGSPPGHRGEPAGVRGRSGHQGPAGHRSPRTSRSPRSLRGDHWPSTATVTSSTSPRHPQDAGGDVFPRGVHPWVSCPSSLRPQVARRSRGGFLRRRAVELPRPRQPGLHRGGCAVAADALVEEIERSGARVDTVALMRKLQMADRDQQGPGARREGSPARSRRCLPAGCCCWCACWVDDRGGTTRRGPLHPRPDPHAPETCRAARDRPSCVGIAPTLWATRGASLAYGSPADDG